ncbi:MAG: isochorismatase family protein [Planctomycetota bacterium]
MSSHDTAMLVVDVQGKLLPLIGGHERLVWNIRRLLDAAEACGVRVLATEQYPKGLGPTDERLKPRLENVAEKTRFSCGECAGLFEGLPAEGIRKILVVGAETHVCISQTVMDLMTAGFDVYVAVDAIGARYPVDHRVGIRRMELSGATLTTSEAAMFEWCEDSKAGPFKTISKLVQEKPPEAESR